MFLLREHQSSAFAYFKRFSRALVVWQLTGSCKREDFLNQARSMQVAFFELSAFE
jgi:hypothetical protein